MKQRWTYVMITLVAALYVSPALAQMGSVRGACKDVEGKPIVGATMEFRNMDSGQVYKLKTNNKGEYFSLGVASGKYNVRLLQDDKEIFHLNGVRVGSDEAPIDIDLKKEHENAAKGQGLTPEQLKQMQEQQAKQQKEVDTVKSLNDKLREASDASHANPPDYDRAISVLNEATQLDPSRFLIWAKLGEVYLDSAGKQTDAAERTRRYTEASNDYEKAIDLKKKAMEAQKNPDPKAGAQELAPYYNNLANAYARMGKSEEAMKAYEQAAQLNPAGAAQYYYNEGAILTNAGKADDAIRAFDKAIAADPTKAEAYYQKGVNLVAKATADPKTGKVIPAPGTLDALNKYLELQPTGTFAEGAKGMIEYLGGSIQTTYGSGKGKRK